MTEATDDDIAAITRIAEEMFRAISWDTHDAPNFAAFAHAVRDDAVLVPAARPVVPTSIAAFVERMRSLHQSGTIRVFEERAGATIVKVFGNLAVAIGGFHAKFDGSSQRGANGFLFVRDRGEWQIAAMAWDNETANFLLPDELV